MTTAYQLNCAQYVLYRDGKPVTAPCDEIALAFDRKDGTLHKHGKPESVQAWAAQARAKLLRGAAEEANPAVRAVAIEMANDITVLQGRFLLEDLNKCLTHSGFVGQLYKQAVAGTLRSLNVMGTTHFRDPAATV